MVREPNTDDALWFFERDPLLASLLHEVRFAALMRDLRAGCDGYRQRYHALAI